ncbi:MAG: NAD-binding protein [Azoarcus sp.]|jgi:Trk K+ transport system NAD-binding subunit|nr:NAD-binding protein [Azoarcus sp.]
MASPLASPSRHHSIFLMIMRRLRAPLILLVVIISSSVLGLTLIPGPEIDGQARYLSFFHAFYFISYTATTIGFGEIPYSFSDQQRLWVMFCIYLSVIGWAYTIGTVFALLADRNLQQAIAMLRFSRAVRRLADPFYLVCGYGETGRLICQALDQRGFRMVVIEVDETRAGEVDLYSYTADVPTLTADAGNPDTLQSAGLTHPNCIGVIALADSDAANLAISISARLLAPRLPVLARAATRETAANMASFGTAHIINPFERFSHSLGLALHAPAAWHLLTWLTGLPGSAIKRHRTPPHGHWILCGHGRFGRLMLDAMDMESIPVTIIDHHPQSNIDHLWIQGDATGPAALEAAGINDAAGLVACTNSDIDNLSIAVTARMLNKNTFIIIRQNHYSNRALFTAFESDITVIPSEIIAHECLAILSTPLLAPFLEVIRQRDEEWCNWLLQRMTRRMGWTVPEIWSARINFTQAPALYRRLMRGETIALDQILHSHANRYEYLACEALYLSRDNDDALTIPAAATPIHPGDELLLAGHPGARAAFELNIGNEHALNYILTGDELRGSWLWEKFGRH